MLVAVLSLLVALLLLLVVGDRLHGRDRRCVRRADAAGQQRDRDVRARQVLVLLVAAHDVTAARSGASSSPKRARATKRPMPGDATSSSFSTSTFPRRSTTSGAPVTFVPS